MDDRRAPCLAAALAAGLWKTWTLLGWLAAPAPPVSLKAVLLHGAPAGAALAGLLKESVCALPAPALAAALAPYALFWGALVAAAAWLALAAGSALPRGAGRALAAGALVAALAVGARAAVEAASGGLSRARLALAVATASRGVERPFARGGPARELSEAELEGAKRALLRRPLLRPRRPRGPFDRVLRLEGGLAPVTAAYDARLGLDGALVRAD